MTNANSSTSFANFLRDVALFGVREVKIDDYEIESPYRAINTTPQDVHLSTCAWAGILDLLCGRLLLWCLGWKLIVHFLTD